MSRDYTKTQNNTTQHNLNIDIGNKKKENKKKTLVPYECKIKTENVQANSSPKDLITNVILYMEMP